MSEHTIVGTLRVLKQIHSPQLDNQRDILVYLPPEYETSAARYPVIYMHDGQNLFDQATAHDHEWQVDETMQALSGAGYPAVVVGIPNMDGERIDEYTPFADQRHGGGKGEAYLAFIVETLKPLIDEQFRTLSDRVHTGIVGSSLGGLISLYALFSRPDVFGFAGALSPSLWFAQEAIFPYVRQAAFRSGRIYLDLGTHEGGAPRPARRPPHTYTSRYLADARRMHALLAAKGYAEGKLLRYVEEEQAPHSEAAWARRLPGALTFLLEPFRRPPAPAEPWWEF